MLVVLLLQLGPQLSHLSIFGFNLYAHFCLDLLADVLLLTPRFGKLLVLTELLAFKQLDLLFFGFDVEFEVVDAAAEDAQVLVEHHSAVALFLVPILPLLQAVLLLLHLCPPLLLYILNFPLILLHELLLSVVRLVAQLVDDGFYFLVPLLNHLLADFLLVFLLLLFHASLALLHPLLFLDFFLLFEFPDLHFLFAGELFGFGLPLGSLTVCLLLDSL